MTERIALHGPVRFIIGVLLLTAAALMVLASEDIGWGVAATTIVPAIFLAIPGLSLMKRKVLRLETDHLEIESGWFWRRCQRIPLQGAGLEIAPMAGLWAVVLRFSQQAVPVAVWVGKAQSLRIAAFLDQAAPDGAWPRVEHERAQWDR